MKKKLLAICVPPKYGGQGRPFIDWLIACEELNRLGPGFFLNRAVVHSSSGELLHIIRNGAEEVKRKYVPAFVNGEAVCAEAMVEPEAGSAVTDLQTNAVASGEEYIINGIKRWVGLASSADVYYTWTRFDNTPGSRGIGIILVDKNAPGLSFGKDQDFWGIQTGFRKDIIFRDCRVSKGNLLSAPGNFRELMSHFNIFRLQNAATCLGIAAGALDVAVAYSQRRKQFGKPLCEFQMVQSHLANMVMKVEAARWLVYRAATMVEDGMAPPLPTSIAKSYCSMIAVEVCDTACQILGAFGFSRESDTEWRYRWARILGPVGAGTIEIQKIRIASELLGRRFDQRAR